MVFCWHEEPLCATSNSDVKRVQNICSNREIFKWFWGQRELRTHVGKIVFVFRILRGGWLLKTLLVDNSIQRGTSFTVTHPNLTQHRKFETNIPRTETAQPPSQFLHSCICEQFIDSHDIDRSAYFAVLWCKPIVGIYKLVTYTWM